MPLFLLKFLPMLRKHWKLIAVAALVVSVFFAGWKVNGWRLETAWEHERAQRAEAVAKALTQQAETIREQYESRLAVVKKQREEILVITDRLREQRDALRVEIDTAVLVKPEVITCPITGETQDVPNPFSDDFVRLWNSGLRE